MTFVDELPQKCWASANEGRRKGAILKTGKWAIEHEETYHLCAFRPIFQGLTPAQILARAECGCHRRGHQLWKRLSSQHAPKFELTGPELRLRQFR